MKHIFKNIAFLSLVAGAGVLASSCEDFLTITPTNKVVEEDFWQDKNDLTSSVYGCYKRLVDNDMLNTYIEWGEVRSDNFDVSSSVSKSSALANIMNANLLPTYWQFDWTKMYNAINYCNKVLAHGPEVVERDEYFSEGEWTPIKAEAITLRAFCHFWLVRTFGEIPYVTEDYNNDSQELRLPQYTQLEVLDNIISELEAVKDQAMKDYGNSVLNHGRITKKAVYTLLADVYLWRASYKAGNCHPFTKIILRNDYAGDLYEGIVREETYSTTAEADYQKCVSLCDEVINMMIAEKTEYIEKNVSTGGMKVELDFNDLLIPNLTRAEMGETNDKPYLRTVNAYNHIFYTEGNSDESIFELQIEGTSYGNGMLRDYFYNPRYGKTGSLTGSTALFEGVESTPNMMQPTSVFTKTDYRRWESLQYESDGQTSFDLAKGVFNTILQYNGNYNELRDNTASNLKISTSITYNGDGAYPNNFIVYRISDVLLMKAEAMSQLYNDEEHLMEAFNYCRATFKRSNPYAYMKGNNTAKDDSLKFEMFATSEGIEALVMAERQREFIGEGKRWFDLVRYAQRRGNTKDMLVMLTRKYASNRKAVEAKLADIQSLFSPVHNGEVKANNLLYQNGVWKLNESTSQTDNL